MEWFKSFYTTQEPYTVEGYWYIFAVVWLTSMILAVRYSSNQTDAFFQCLMALVFSLCWFALVPLVIAGAVFFGIFKLLYWAFARE